VSPPPAAARAHARAAADAAPAPLRRPPAPRRVSGPERHPRALPRPARHTGPVVRLLDSPFLDRLIRGRLWIALVAFALLGIVAMQVAILRLGASIGESVAQIQHLTASNEAAATAIAQDEPGRHVAVEASKLGMVYPPPGNVVYLRYAAGVATAAAHAYTLPTAPVFSSAPASLTAPIAPATSAAATTGAATTAAPAATGITAPAGATTPTTATSDGASVTPETTSLGSGGGSSAPATGATG
jgi:hypothetical protein